MTYVSNIRECESPLCVPFGELNDPNHETTQTNNRTKRTLNTHYPSQEKKENKNKDHNEKEIGLTPPIKNIIILSPKNALPFPLNTHS